jgi:hypothetical protein
MIDAKLCLADMALCVKEKFRGTTIYLRDIKVIWFLPLIEPLTNVKNKYPVK